MTIYPDTGKRRRACSTPGCSKSHEARGLCSKHYQRKRYRTDPQYREKAKARGRARRRGTVKAQRNARDRERYRTDAEYRERRKLVARDPRYRERRAARQAERYRTDAGYRERLLAGLRERRANDPAYRARLNARQLARYHRKGGNGYQRWRGTLVLRQRFKCAICGELLDQETAHVDHVIPVSKWPPGKPGVDAIENLQATHGACNMGKGNRA